jgi:hypothetical protein
MKNSSRAIELQKQYLASLKQNEPQPEQEPEQKEKPIINSLGTGKDFGIYIEGINKAVPLIHMEDKEVVQILLNHYSSVLNHIAGQNDPQRIMNYLVIQYVHRGVCNYSRIKLGVNVCDRWWINKYKSGPHIYWGIIPEHQPDARGMILAISLRVDKLHNILNEIKQNEIQ